MAKEKKNLWVVAASVFFTVYFLAAARPVPRETVLRAGWLSSLESDRPVFPNASTQTRDALGETPSAAVPFALGGRFGYVDANGRFAVNRVTRENIALSESKWAEYGAMPETLDIRDISGETVETIDNPRGYPLFLDGRVFILNSEQNALSETDGSGGVLWTHEFAAPLTCADAANGLVLAGSIDGMAVVLDSAGREIFSFEPGGSRYDLVLGCAFSRDGSRFALVSGIGQQRFLLLERFGSFEYRVVYHEFVGEGFRRPLYAAFVDTDSRVVFECEGGVCVYDINSRKSRTVALEGEVAALDQLGSNGRLFVIVKQDSAGSKKLVGINLPEKVFLRAPFKAEDVFLGRAGSRLIVGGGTTLVSFGLEER